MPKNRDKKCKQLTDFFPHLVEKFKKEKKDLDEMSHIFSEMSQKLRQSNLKVRGPTKLIEKIEKLREMRQRERENPLRSEEESQNLDEKILRIEISLKDMLKECKVVEKYCEKWMQKNNEIHQKLLECYNILLEEKELEFTPGNLREWLQTFEKNCQDLIENINDCKEFEDEISENIEEILQELKEKPQHLGENPHNL
ncbi:hypothetical protein Avbf_16609 [Armadillidium vulgare]|nr:hypothetical protein Avbf_16609 [Armadillidium vulgare]